MHNLDEYDDGAFTRLVTAASRCHHAASLTPWLIYNLDPWLRLGSLLDQLQPTLLQYPHQIWRLNLGVALCVTRPDRSYMCGLIANMHQHSCSSHKEKDISVQIPVRRAEIAPIPPLSKEIFQFLWTSKTCKFKIRFYVFIFCSSTPILRLRGKKGEFEK